MKTENFERAKAIEKEIEKLVDYISALKSDRATTMHLFVKGKTGESLPETHYSHKYGSCPDFLKETLKFQLDMVCDVIVKKVEDHIKTLEKEFESL